ARPRWEGLAATVPCGIVSVRNPFLPWLALILPVPKPAPLADGGCRLVNALPAALLQDICRKFHPWYPGYRRFSEGSAGPPGGSPSRRVRCASRATLIVRIL